MAGAKFEYDEKGTTFYYFLISFYALVLIPLTYYVWNNIKNTEDKKKTKRECNCPPCQEKRHHIRKREPKTKTLKYLSITVIVILWIVFFAGAYKISQFDRDFAEYDPYAVLEIDRVTSVAEIRRQYRSLSKKYHPDKETGDPRKFMRIAKAYEALTNEESRKNWEEHGNPDGPGATSFGIALPSWLVSKENSMWVLAAYGLAFMIILPISVGTWWYKSIQYSCDQILLDTTQLYYYFFHKTPAMQIKRILMILAGSLEFEKGHNGEVQERVTDNIEIPQLMRDLPNLGDKNKEPPLCYPYSIKARSLIHAHLGRMELPPETLKQDLHLILKKGPMLIQEMINCVAQLIAMAKAGRTSNMPRLDTVENVMKVCPMLVQGLWDNKSPLLQLPHLNQENLRHFTTKKRNIRSIRQLISMREDERRALLRGLGEEEYQDIINVCWMLPSVEMSVRAHDKTLITVGDIVTISTTLKRRVLGEFFDDEEAEQQPPTEEQTETRPEDKDSPKPQKVWLKNKKKGKKAKPNKQQKDEKEDEKKENDDKNNDSDDGEEGDEEKDDKIDSGEEDSGDEGSGPGDSDGENDKTESNTKSPEEDEEEWERLQADVKNIESVLETKSKETYPVHAPYFPLEKQEWWWIYVTDRRKTALITPPSQVCTLRNEEEVELKFQAPEKPGTYYYTVTLRSDSYLDCDVHQNFKV
ncbi:predicted protein, partial [Nematostella vectensis]